MDSMARIGEILKQSGLPTADIPSKVNCSSEEQKKADAQRQCDSYNKEDGHLHEQDGYECETCKNKGFIAEVAKSEFGYYYPLHRYCKCQKVRNAIRRLNKSGLKNIIKDYTFKTYETEEPWQKTIKDTAARFIQDDQNTWFFIGGMTGCGKTHICTAIAGYYLRHGKSVKYMLWRDDVVKLKANVTNPEEYAKMMDELKTSEVLYIDDLFKTGKDAEGKPQRPTAADVNVAFEILNYRYNNPSLITIISSECKVTDMLDIDEAVAGRIAEKTSARGYGLNINHDRTKNYRLRGTIEL